MKKKTVKNCFSQQLIYAVKIMFTIQIYTQFFHNVFTTSVKLAEVIFENFFIF